MNRNRKTLVLGIIAVTFMMIAAGGLAYAWFSASVTGNQDATQTIIETADLRLVFNDTEFLTLDNVLPGASETKTFTVSNIGNVRVKYEINLVNIANTFVNNDLVYTLTSTNDGATVVNSALPTIDSILVDSEVDPGVTQTYTLVVTFRETGADQNSNMGANFSGKLQITSTSTYTQP